MLHFNFCIIVIAVLSVLLNYVYFNNNRKLKKLNRDLKLQRTYFDKLFENSQDAIVILDNKSRIISVNKAFEVLFQHKNEEVRGSSVDSILADYETKDAFELSNIVMQGKTVTAADTKRKRKDGTLIEVSVLAFPVILDTNQIGIYAVYKDIRDRKKSEQALELQKTYFRKLFENSPEAICIIDNEDRFIDINYAFEKLFGYSKDELIAHYINNRIVSNELVNEATKISEEVMDGKVIEYESTRIRKDGSIVEVCILGYPIVFESKQVGVFGIYRNITERKKMDRELIYMSTHDGLTGLYNRIYFENLLSKYDKEKKEELGIIVCDVDGLKLVNDNLGHDCGDKLLVNAADIIRIVCEENNGIAARIGGDEFIIIINNCLKDELELANELLQKSIGEFNSNDSNMYLSISTGISYRGKEFKTMTELFKQADNHMYYHKACRKEENVKKIMYKIMQNVI
ncbi:PAS domain S-box protein [Clostridiaceae bacterium UIB06]|uniref:PAS domain S-box protein n=1 Tax=Clostridium thailandense TaxID=2794346 RepID=A0A949U3R8_9CLOT|nr:PAS domain S-box protein [Clostridium thailandense]MBV7276940.1 PAS domain S-box protein [Clostridium thailandense]MCH5138709.1 PAS domain S-box protein [Clostridiaceae bacterium UIB06]